GTYVTSDVAPTEMFAADELEFNIMTKYFYADRTLPKKRLTEAEMEEINRLYRIVGAGERMLTDLRGPPPGAQAAAAAGGMKPEVKKKIFTLGVFGVAAGLAFLFVMSSKKPV